MNLPFEYDFTWKVLWWSLLCEGKSFEHAVDESEWQLFTVSMCWKDMI